MYRKEFLKLISRAVSFVFAFTTFFPVRLAAYQSAEEVLSGLDMSAQGYQWVSGREIEPPEEIKQFGDTEYNEFSSNVQKYSASLQQGLREQADHAWGATQIYVTDFVKGAAAEAAQMTTDAKGVCRSLNSAADGAIAQLESETKLQVGLLNAQRNEINGELKEQIGLLNREADEYAALKVEVEQELSAVLDPSKYKKTIPSDFYGKEEADDAAYFAVNVGIIEKARDAGTAIMDDLGEKVKRDHSRIENAKESTVPWLEDELKEPVQDLKDAKVTDMKAMNGIKDKIDGSIKDIRDAKKSMVESVNDAYAPMEKALKDAAHISLQGMTDAQRKSATKEEALKLRQVLANLEEKLESSINPTTDPRRIKLLAPLQERKKTLEEQKQKIQEKLDASQKKEAGEVAAAKERIAVDRDRKYAAMGWEKGDRVPVPAYDEWKEPVPGTNPVKYAKKSNIKEIEAAINVNNLRIERETVIRDWYGRSVKKAADVIAVAYAQTEKTLKASIASKQKLIDSVVKQIQKKVAQLNAQKSRSNLKEHADVIAELNRIIAAGGTTDAAALVAAVNKALEHTRAAKKGMIDDINLEMGELLEDEQDALEAFNTSEGEMDSEYDNMIKKMGEDCAAALKETTDGYDGLLGDNEALGKELEEKGKGLEMDSEAGINDIKALIGEQLPEISGLIDDLIKTTKDFAELLQKKLDEINAMYDKQIGGIETAYAARAGEIRKLAGEKTKQITEATEAQAQEIIRLAKTGGADALQYAREKLQDLIAGQRAKTKEFTKGIYDKLIAQAKAEKEKGGPAGSGSVARSVESQDQGGYTGEIKKYVPATAIENLGGTIESLQKTEKMLDSNAVSVDVVAEQLVNASAMGHSVDVIGDPSQGKGKIVVEEIKMSETSSLPAVLRSGFDHRVWTDQLLKMLAGSAGPFKSVADEVSSMLEGQLGRIRALVSDTKKGNLSISKEIMEVIAKSVAEAEADIRAITAAVLAEMAAMREELKKETEAQKATRRKLMDEIKALREKIQSMLKDMVSRILLAFRKTVIASKSKTEKSITDSRKLTEDLRKNAEALVAEFKDKVTAAKKEFADELAGLSAETDKGSAESSSHTSGVNKIVLQVARAISAMRSKL